MPFFDSIRIGASGAAGDFTVDRSLRFERNDPTYLQATLGDGNEDKWTWSGWVKKTVNGQHQNLFSSGDQSVYTHINFDNNDRIRFQNWHSAQKGTKITTRKCRDNSAWMHIVVIWDSGNSTADDRMRIYVNGIRETAFDDSTNPDQNQDSVINGNTLGGSDYGEGKHFIGKFADTSDNSSTYKAEINFVDGQAYDPSYFAETNADTGQWVPKKYAGSYGTNGFYLKFSDNSGTTATTLGKDSSGNGNNFTPNNFSVSAGTGNDSLADTPTNNFCTLNPLDKTNDASLRDGALTLYTDSNDQAATGTFGITSGKWYWEVDKNATEPEIGIAHFQMPLSNKSTSLPADGQIAFIVSGADSNTNFLRVNGSTTTGTGMSAQTGTGSIGIALDMDNKKIWWSDLSGNYFNSGNPATGANAQVDFSSTGEYPNGVTPFVSIYQGSAKTTSINFGQRPFTHTAPTGFETLCTANLPDPTIKLPNEHFNTVLYTGNNSTNVITGVGFQPDWFWIKDRSTTGEDHHLFDAVRGLNKALYSNQTDAETTGFDGGGQNNITAVGSDGFTITGNGSNGEGNLTGRNYVAWNWNAGGTTVTNTDGTISAQVRASTTAGFSIATYSGNDTAGATLGHGLGVAPDIVIVKWRNGGDNWLVYSENAGSGRTLWLDSTSVVPTGSAYYGYFWNDTPPSSSLITLGSNGAINGSGRNYVAYCFSSVAGYSKFGKYTGNGNANGTFVFTGFRPAFLIIRRTDSGDNWVTRDAKRNPFNDVDSILNPNSNGAEFDASSQAVDFVSNGVKIRGSDSGTNGSGGTYIYLAFAESPFRYARAR